MSPRRRAADVAADRDLTLRHALAVASEDGLEGLTIGRLADELTMSKSGLFGRFGSKEDLQLAVVAAAADRFRREAWEPMAGEPAGLARLRAAAAAWLSYLEREVFPGGCVLTAAAHEFDGRPGPVRDAVRAAWAAWLDQLARDAAAARRAGELPEGAAEPAQLAFELQGVMLAANWSYQLWGDATAFARARAAIDRLLGPSG